jgi:hypothetical protein
MSSTNSAFFKVLVTMGRAMSSSCRILHVISVAKRKLKNGNSNCIDAHIAPLLVRANIDVNFNHAARNLIKNLLSVNEESEKSFRAPKTLFLAMTTPKLAPYSQI